MIFLISDAPVSSASVAALPKIRIFGQRLSFWGGRFSSCTGSFQGCKGRVSCIRHIVGVWKVHAHLENRLGGQLTPLDSGRMASGVARESNTLCSSTPHMREHRTLRLHQAAMQKERLGARSHLRRTRKDGLRGLPHGLQTEPLLRPPAELLSRLGPSLRPDKPPLGCQFACMWPPGRFLTLQRL